MENQNNQAPKPGGFTVVEVVIVCLVMGLMMAIILPGLLGGRQMARRVQCANNMRQAAVALHHYHEIHDCLPPAWFYNRSNPNAPQWAWWTTLLPILEQSLLYTTLAPGPCSITDTLAVGPTGAQYDISTATCEEDKPDSSHPTKRFDQGLGIPKDWQPPKANYIANIGFFYRTADYENHGAMYGNSAVPMRAIVDGTSSTFLFGERDSLGGAATWVGVADPQDDGVNGFAWVGGVVSVPMNCPDVEGCRDRGFASQHPGGSQFAFCDGSVRFLSETIDFNNGSADRYDSKSDTLLTKAEKAELGVYQCLGVRDDHRPIGRLP